MMPTLRPAPLLLIAAVTLFATSVVRGQSVRPGVSTYLTLTSDYRDHGLSQSRGQPSAQLGVDYQHASGFFAGAWAAGVEYFVPELPDASRDVELDFYAGYNWRNPDWSMAATLARYAYPGSTFDYDYDEVSASVGYRRKVFLTVSYADDLLSRDLPALNQELSVVLPFVWNTEFGAVLGLVESEALLPRDRYTHWNVGLTKLVKGIGIDLRYYHTSREIYGPLGTSEAPQWVLSASYGFDAL